eukprot:1161734-Pelagomonas_calceolata.AAC.24
MPACACVALGKIDEPMNRQCTGSLHIDRYRIDGSMHIDVDWMDGPMRRRCTGSMHIDVDWMGPCAGSTQQQRQLGSKYAGTHRLLKL